MALSFVVPVLTPLTPAFTWSPRLKSFLIRCAKQKQQDWSQEVLLPQSKTLSVEEPSAS